jgi:hypothetical protein
MALKLMVPGQAIADTGYKLLKLDFPASCSRCGALAADRFETHRLLFRAGYRPTHLMGRRYAINRTYLLKLSLCQACYQSDFLTAPETIDRDATPLGRLARVHSVIRMVGGAIAALGFLLLTPFIPETAALAQVKRDWLLPVIIGVAVIMAGWLSMRAQQKRLVSQMQMRDPQSLKLPRAETRIPILESASELSAIALEIKVENEAWGQACAAHNHWQAEVLTEEH